MRSGLGDRPARRVLRADLDLLAEGDGAQARDAEVEHLRHAVLREEDVLGLDVAMNDAGGVRRGEDVEQAVGDRERVLRAAGGSPNAARARVGRLAFEELHHEEGRAVLGLVVVEDAHDARMVHRVRDVPLAREARADVGEHRQLRVEDLERDAASVAVGRRVDGAHPADAEQLVDAPLALDPRPHARLGHIADARVDLRHRRATNDSTQVAAGPCGPPRSTRTELGFSDA